MVQIIITNENTVVCLLRVLFNKNKCLYILSWMIGGRQFEDDSRKRSDDDQNRRGGQDRDRYGGSSRRDHESGRTNKYTPPNHSERGIR
jgi:hypothetical protein